jgi:hypothetical protein
MIMVIFGAGASYDSVPAVPAAHQYRRDKLSARPPLATELFDDRLTFAAALRNFPQCNPIIPYLRSLPNEETIEHALEMLQIESDSDPERRRQLAAVRYYLHSMIWECDVSWKDRAGGITNYVTILDQLRRCRQTLGTGPVLLITFNYDRLIEYALPSVGITITDLPHYIQHESFKLYKLHGSVHWAREVDTPIADLNHRADRHVAYELIDRAATDLKVSNRFRTVSAYPIAKIENVPLFPALALPVETKLGFECPSDHLDSLCSHLDKITKILVVGWRATEGHFLSLLKQHVTSEVHVQAVAGGEEEGKQILKRFVGLGFPVVGHVIDGGFTDYIVSREAERFFGT